MKCNKQAVAHSTDFVLCSTIILFASHRHDDRYGPKSNFGRRQEEELSKEESAKEEIGV